MQTRPFIRSNYNYDRDEASEMSGLDCKDITRTKQEFKDETDINTILKRFAITGHIPENVRMPTYGDFTGITDFHEAANAIVLARESFEEMPATVRARFNNDPGQFVDFCSDPKNIDEARTMGLAPPKPEPLSSTGPGPHEPPTAILTPPQPPKTEDGKTSPT